MERVKSADVKPGCSDAAWHDVWSAFDTGGQKENVRVPRAALEEVVACFREYDHYHVEKLLVPPYKHARRVWVRREELFELLKRHGQHHERMWKGARP